MYYLLLLSLFSTFIIWLFNLEVNPSMGNVWLRPNDKNQITFAWRSIFTLLLEPFKNSYMWKPKNWDINFYTLFMFVFLLAYFIDKTS